MKVNHDKVKYVITIEPSGSFLNLDITSNLTDLNIKEKLDPDSYIIKEKQNQFKIHITTKKAYDIILDIVKECVKPFALGNDCKVENFLKVKEYDTN